MTKNSLVCSKATGLLDFSSKGTGLEADHTLRHSVFCAELVGERNVTEHVACNKYVCMHPLLTVAKGVIRLTGISLLQTGLRKQHQLDLNQGRLLSSADVLGHLTT